MNNTLIFSTRNLKSKPVWGIWVVMILFPPMAFLGLPVFWATILTGFVLGSVVIGFFNIAKIKKSYIDIYGNKIVGVDLKGVSFELRYDEILRLDFQEGTVGIYFLGGSYNVKAPYCEQKVISIIKQQQEINSH